MQVKFLQSTADFKACPAADLPEFAFIGRSNVGKSSLINMLANQKHLAHTSSKPGKTQTINHFLVNYVPKKDNPTQKTISWYMADLPGYGYAHVSKEKKQQFDKLIAGYTLTRKNLLTLFVLIDSRLDPQPIDLGFLQFLGENQVPFTLLFTKADKLSGNKLARNIEKFKQSMLESWEELPPMFITSAVTRQGRDEIIAYMVDCIKKYWKSSLAGKE